MSITGPTPTTVDPIADLARQVADLTARLAAVERRIDGLMGIGPTVFDREWLRTQAPPAAVAEVACRIGRPMTSTVEDLLAHDSPALDATLAKVRDAVSERPHRYQPRVGAP